MFWYWGGSFPSPVSTRGISAYGSVYHDLACSKVGLGAVQLDASGVNAGPTHARNSSAITFRVTGEYQG